MCLNRRLARIVAPSLACWYAAVGVALALEPGVSYFADEFDASLIPWRPAPERNVEEVFKNHQYYEIVLGRDRATIAVVRHRQDRAPERLEYRILPSGGLVPASGSPTEVQR